MEKKRSESTIVLPSYVSRFMDIVVKQGFEIYLVGGAVRNILLGHTTDNWDFATSAKPEQIQKLFPQNFYHNDYGTVSVPVKTDNKTLLFEITPYRHESGYSDKRHPDQIEWADTVEQDLNRRDFTINALALSASTELSTSSIEGIAIHIVDPHNGAKDLTDKLIRAVGDPKARFAEDALRMLRAIRFMAQFGFTIEKETQVAIKKHAAEITHVSWERIRDEFFKILMSNHPAEGVLVLKSTGLLASILPELEACFGVEQKSPGRHHIYDVGTHLVESLRACKSDDVITRLATLIHDVGKVQTVATDEKSGTITFYNHEILGAQQAETIADRLRLSREQKNKLVLLVRNHMFSVTEHQTDKAIRRFIRHVGLENISDILALRTADRIGSGATETSWRTEEFKQRIIEVQKAPFSIRDLKINGVDVMKELELKPGPRVGEILNEIFEAVDDGKLANDRDKLLKTLAAYK